MSTPATQSTFVDDDDDDDDEEDALQRKLQQTNAEREEKAQKPRFYCAGYNRIDDDIGKRWCNYRARKSWRGNPCPACHRMFDCLPIRSAGNSTQRVNLGSATMEAASSMVYYPTGIPELDKVLNGGVTRGTVIMVSAPPGTGKSTLLLQACDGFVKVNHQNAYFATAEMTRDAVLTYAKRLGIANERVSLFSNPEGIDVDDLFEDILATKSRFAVLDSLQVATCRGIKGDIGNKSMGDAVINMLSSFAQKKRRAIFVIGHMNTDGSIAGGRKAAHLVDGLLRMDIQYVGYDNLGAPRDIGLRQLRWDGKTRQGPHTVTSYVEMSPEGRLVSPSPRALRELMGLHGA